MNFVSFRFGLLSMLMIGLGAGSLGCRRVDACPPGYREEPHESRCYQPVTRRDGSIELGPEPIDDDDEMEAGPMTAPPKVPVPRDGGWPPSPASPADAGQATDGRVGPILADAGGELPRDAGRAADAGTDAGPTAIPPGMFATWHPRETVNVALSERPDLIAWPDGRVEAFWADGTLRHISNAARPSRWGNVEDLGAPVGVTLRGPVDAVSWGPGRIDVFARGSDNRLWHTAFVGGSWISWDNPGGVSGLGSSPHACSWGAERLDIVWLTSDGGVGHIAYVDLRFGWSRVDQLGAPEAGLEGEARIATWGFDRVDIVARGRDRRLWHTYWDKEWVGRWGNPLEVSGVGEGPELIPRAPGRLDFVWTSADANVLQVLTFNGSNFDELATIEAPPGVNIQQRPALSSWASARLDVVMAGNGNRLWHAYYEGVSWQWDSFYMDSDLVGEPTVQSAGVDQLVIAFPVQRGKLGYASYF